MTLHGVAVDVISGALLHPVALPSPQLIFLEKPIPVEQENALQRGLGKVTDFLNKREFETAHASLLLVQGSVGIAALTSIKTVEPVPTIFDNIGFVSGAFNIVSFAYTIKAWANFKKLSAAERCSLVAYSVIQIVGTLVFLAKCGLQQLGKLMSEIGRIPVLDFLVNSLALAPLSLLFSSATGYARLKEYKDHNKNLNEHTETLKKVKEKQEAFEKLLGYLDGTSLLLRKDDHHEWLATIEASLCEAHPSMKVLDRSQKITILVEAQKTIKFKVQKLESVIANQHLSGKKLKLALINDVMGVSVAVLALVAIVLAAVYSQNVEVLDATKVMNTTVTVLGCGSTGFWAFRCYYNFKHRQGGTMVIFCDTNIVLPVKLEGHKDPENLAGSADLIRALAN